MHKCYGKRICYGGKNRLHHAGSCCAACCKEQEQAVDDRRDARTVTHECVTACSACWGQKGVGANLGLGGLRGAGGVAWQSKAATWLPQVTWATLQLGT